MVKAFVEKSSEFAFKTWTIECWLIQISFNISSTFKLSSLKIILLTSLAWNIFSYILELNMLPGIDSLKFNYNKPLIRKAWERIEIDL